MECTLTCYQRVACGGLSHLRSLGASPHPRRIPPRRTVFSPVSRELSWSFGLPGVLSARLSFHWQLD
ncbi:MAG: hypothetical protein ACFFCZ_03605 [Promethearchaeota archaeon]